VIYVTDNTDVETVFNLLNEYNCHRRALAWKA